MKAIIPAAGYAIRLYPLTSDRPKHLLTIGDRPLLEHVIENIEKITEIDEIIIITNDRFHPVFKEWLSFFKSKIRIRLMNDGTKSNDDRLGAFGDVNLVVRREKIDDDLMVIAGDNYFEFDMRDFYNSFLDKKSSVVALYDVNDKSKAAKRYGVVELDSTNRIIGFEEKPENPKTSLASTACYIFAKKDLPEFEIYASSHINLDNLGDFITHLSQKTMVHGYVFKEKWYDIGSLDQLNELNGLLRCKQ